VSHTPQSTYRVQLHAGFDFDAAAGIADYLAELGVTHLYCSPILQAAPGSTHGYDVVDPHRVNVGLGGAERYAAMVGALAAAGLGQVLDIVPNHMSVHPSNPWWWDVLENGPASRYAGYFDIDWAGTADKASFTVLVPVLADQYGRVLEAGAVHLERREGSVVVRYEDHLLPVSPRTLDALLGQAARRAGSGQLAGLAEAFGALPDARITDTAAVRERDSRKRTLASELKQLCLDDPEVAAEVDAELASVSREPGRLDELLRRQNYRLAHWRVASEELDYRRFFNIETLVGMRVEDPDVFADTHRLILDLVHEGTVDGLRVDHVDGMRDPAGYLERLAQATEGTYTVVEKILGDGEPLPSTWPVAGTSGYDFLTRVNGLFVAVDAEPTMTDTYSSFTGDPRPFGEIVRAAKLETMGNELASEVDHATSRLALVTDRYRRHRDHTRRDLRAALVEFVAAFPVYRTYVEPPATATDVDHRHVEATTAAVEALRPDIDRELVELLGELALGRHDGADELELTQRLQQLTAPVTAKGVEDTAFYRYNRLVSLNEVGGDPGRFGRPLAQFHAETQTQATSWPHTMLALGTHDTKRSADVRARTNLLSELATQWDTAVTRWGEGNERHRVGEWPDRNAEYLLYQTLLGAWPIEPPRLRAFMIKAVREAKVHTSWIEPSADYEDALEAFVDGITEDPWFHDDLRRFMVEHDVVERGRRNSMAQTALLFTCPGVPDLYQGSELWDLSLVDPDNRRPVDYDARRRLLTEVGPLGPAEALRHRDDGGLKLWEISRLLHHRRAFPYMYESTFYEPLTLRGARADEVVGFTRGGLTVLVPRLGSDHWEGTEARLPPGHWSDVLTATHFEGGPQPLAELFAGFPVAVLARTS
jgi:(1->4)-alpha-D-glucan 1-alpha-D-glucosylmutase